MDKITTQNLKCTKHSNKDFQFVQINDVISQSSSKKPLFYCSSCINDDFEFKAINYLLIDQIIQETDSKIIPKWPPVNDYHIIQDLIEFTSNQSQCDYVKQITDFFNQFKEEILAKIDIIQKNMINEALKYPNHSQVIERYQEISKISEFKQLLNNNNNQETSIIEENLTLFREFISQIESQKDQNTEQLQNLLSQANFLEKNFNLNRPNIMKQQIFACIDNISFFKNDLSQDMINKNSENNQQANINNQNNNRAQKMSAELIMKLVSNKSNFCSDQFLKELEQVLQGLNHLLQEYNFKIIHTENKKAIDFSKISEEKLNQIEDYVKHQILLTNQFLYENEKIQNENFEKDSQLEIGLISNSNLVQQNKGLFDRSSTINKKLKGDQFKVSKDNMIELRVCLKDQILEVVDYPNYQYKLGLDDTYKENLTKIEDLKFYLGLKDSGIKIVLKEAQIVNEFKN
ncbi:zinc carboxypeptidase family protein (macronuclear) [Tetrahymena thermophila SB210]|uniref:Zinc carboxypeptidase family protein n=1 Tax=Tetrahymena thermophila (strain SB210) TaxID=312017 RepID=Q22XP5_TETTS|nr:zinc carboxypeptidase family protein [Tetrahymena thermophila SB210]EAR90034.2 zinc carboxypeptidase family protein [Tetrahymena thermophila SB210]|eukprot:XP_001010279.2 zinc carboxypeptidase family protein [Tetrahymena thermophila SB210]